MVNRFETLIDQWRGIAQHINQINHIPKEILSSRKKITELAGLNTQLKQILHRINNFGQKHKVIRLEFIMDGAKHFMYLTDIEAFEATSFANHFYTGKVTHLQVYAIPVGKPLKLEITPG